MKIGATYSHMNGEEFLLVHHPEIREEILTVIGEINSEDHRVKLSKEKRKLGKYLYSPDSLNKAFFHALRNFGWESHKYGYYITINPDLVKESESLPPNEQKALLEKKGIKNPIRSYKQTDFVKDQVAIEVQFGKYAFVAYDLFVKHMLFYSGRVINVGVEILPMKKMQEEMSSGIAYYEGEVYNVLRHGRSSPPVPLFVIGIEPE